MNIAICDDNNFIIGKLESMILSCFHDKINDYNCDAYTSAEELLKTLSDEPITYQIYILDIEMEEIDGLQAAAKIREFDQDALIIFVTSHEELMAEAFNVYAFHFIVKPFDEEAAKGIILRAIHTIKQRNILFQFVVRKKTYTLYLNQITCFESINRKIIIHTSSREQYEYYGTLKELKQRLNTHLFVQIHNSYIINMEHIKTMSGEGILLNSGETITITKSYHMNFHNTYKNFVLTRMR